MWVHLKHMQLIALCTEGILRKICKVDDLVLQTSAKVAVGLKQIVPVEGHTQILRSDQEKVRL